jgi:hypothetical protein
MHRGIIQSALANRLPLELDYREPSADEGFTPLEMGAQPASEEFAWLLHALSSGQENHQ